MRLHTRLLVFGVLALALALPVAGIGQGKNITATVAFRNGFDDKIRGDNVSGGKPIVATISSGDGSFYLVDNAETGHRLHLVFDVPTEPPPTPYNCRTWGEPDWTYAMPRAYDLGAPTGIQIWTFAQFSYDEAHGWAPVMNPLKKGSGTPTEHWLDLRRDVPPGGKAYVQFLIRVWVNSTNDYYDLLMNRVWPWGGRSVRWNGGIVEVQAPNTNAPVPGAAGDTFTFRPVVAGTAYPLPGLGQNEALLRATDQSDYGKDTSGPCHMGEFSMPFEMTVTRK